MVVNIVSYWNFQDEFRQYGRENSFSYEGLKALYDYLNDLSDDIGEPIEMDVIGFCSEYDEFDSIEEYNKDYDTNYQDVEELEYDQTVIAVLDNGGFIVVSH